MIWIFSPCALKNSIEQIFYEINQFHLHSGFELSYEKTTMYRIGSLRFSSAEMYDQSQVAWSNQDINVLGVQVAHGDIVQKNYNSMPKKIKSILDSWRHRGLSLLGKIQVVNALIASLFVYKMMVLPLLSEIFIKNIENIIRNFIWNGKKAKITLSILQNSKEQGGLGLVNLRNKEKALKATWPLILYKEPQYASLVYKIMRLAHVSEDIWRCHISPGDVLKLRISNQFWKDVLLSWSEYNYFTNYDIASQLIWYNSEIKVGGKVIAWKDSIEKGLKYVHQLFEEQSFKSQEVIKQEFGLNSIRYNSLISAIPRHYKEHFFENSKYAYLPSRPHNYDTAVLIGKGFSKVVYHRMTGDITLLHNKFLKWTQDLGVDIAPSLKHYAERLKDVFSITNIAKLRSFQYRLLQRGLVTNINLKQWNIIDSELCTFCHQAPESVMHLMIECSEVKSMWTQFYSYIQNRFGVQDICVNPRDRILNQIVKSRNSVVNFVCLLFKQFLYRQRCLKEVLDFKQFERYVKNIEHMEKFIAKKNNRLDTHQKKWVGSAQETFSLRAFLFNYNEEM